MKQFNTCKSLLLATFLGAAGVAQGQVAQTSHPLAFENLIGTTTFRNFYKDYVGVRVQVTAPSVIAGDYDYTTSNDGYSAISATNWGGSVTTPIVDVPVYMGSGGAGSGDDSFGCSTFTASMAGKIAVIWRGPGIAGSGTGCEFSAKANNAQAAGAVAVIIVNQAPGEGPVGMGGGAGFASVTIPVFMVGNLDGIRIAAQYRTLPPGSVKMTITPWGKSLSNDLGFVPGGASMWAYSAIPFYQFNAAPTHNAYKGMDGAFIANYGTNDQTNVKLNTNVTYTPTGGSAASIHTGTLTVTPSSSSTTFAAIDSIYTVFSPEYNLTGITGKGRVDINYLISSDATDDFAADNSYVHTFHLTDSVFSKGRYDFANNRPAVTLYTGGVAPFMWGVPYFVAKGGDAMKDIQFSISTGPGVLTVGNMNFYIFKWVDGAPGATFLDSVIENGELELVGTACHPFNGTTDSSFNFFNAAVTNDTDITDLVSGGGMMKLSDNTWYFVVAEVPGTTSVAIGCDGILNAYSRSYGRAHFNNYVELYNPVFGGDELTLRTDPANAFANWSFSGAPFDVDSVTYNTQYGLVPALAFRVAPYSNVGVHTTATSSANVQVYPNPANDKINVALNLPAVAKEVTFTILNTMGRVVSTDKMNNVQNDTYSYTTSQLPAGNYFIVVNADGKQMHKKFTVIK
ncbi:MAG: T9SS type A sorting domain-containing protein [Bacteroidota bacterium]